MNRGLNFNKIKTKLGNPIPIEKALKDVEPFKWSNEVLSGNKRIIVSHSNK